MPAVRMRGITKRYPGVVANDAVDFTVESASIHGLLGENGAGKSTLMKVLFGLTAPSAGTVEIAGRPVVVDSARDALDLGIGMVQQHFSLIGDFTVAENLVLGSEPLHRGGLLDLDRAAADIAALSDRYGFRIDPRSRVGDLAVGARQRVEILKALYRGAEVLILDEPTAALAPTEVAELVGLLRRLRAQGRTVVFISHKLSEVIDLCDRVTVLRGGRVEGHREIGPAERDDPERHDALAAELARMMVGHELPDPPERVDGPERGGVPVLRLSAAGDGRRLGPIDLEVQAGEIVGVAGVEGNGQTELVEMVVGVRRCRAGSVHLGGTDVTRWSVRRRLNTGVAHIAEDRHGAAVADGLDLAHNATLGFQGRPPFSRRGLWLSLVQMRRLARGVVNRFGVQAVAVTDPLRSLSGGNQQKLVVGRELSRGPELFVAAQPTRGLDVAAAAFVHSELAALRRRKAGVLLVSLELTEILALADRIVVMSGGQIAGETSPSEVDVTTLGRWMTGGGAVGEPEPAEAAGAAT
ncbi:MAG: ABC transporter ATP-binding protein [Acidimicrobiaceae bacterium]|nr:ABC transporter ATP-binding protein [Acidimicrobiaceae bacterium]MDE0515344.1 ABC transporter ATP-binding protein [Acidimicrobiaceae bacterium]